jgi:hypothetical protein
MPVVMPVVKDTVFVSAIPVFETELLLDAHQQCEVLRAWCWRESLAPVPCAGCPWVVSHPSLQQEQVVTKVETPVQHFYTRAPKSSGVVWEKVSRRVLCKTWFFSAMHGLEHSEQEKFAGLALSESPLPPPLELASSGSQVLPLLVLVMVISQDLSAGSFHLPRQLSVV